MNNKTARIKVEESFGGEPALAQAIEEYDFHVDGAVHKETGLKADLFRLSTVLPSLLLRFGALRSYETWLEKSLQAFQEIGPFTDYVLELHEVVGVTLNTGAPILVICGFEDDARGILAVTGLAEWTDIGMDALWATTSAAFPFGRSHTRRAIIYARTHAHIYNCTRAPTLPYTFTRTQWRT